MKRDKETSNEWVWQIRKKMEDLLNKQEKVGSNKSGTISPSLRIRTVLFFLSSRSRENHDKFSVVSVSCPPWSKAIYPYLPQNKWLCEHSAVQKVWVCPRRKHSHFSISKQHKVKILKHILSTGSRYGKSG